MNQAQLELIINARDQASRVMKDVQTNMGKLNDIAKNVARQGLGAMKSAFDKVAIGLVGLKVGLGLFGKSTLQAASDYEETSSKFNVVFGDMADATRDWVNTTATDLGRSRTQLEGYMATLQDTFVPMGFARDEAQGMSKQITELGIDLASFNNMADADVIKDLTSAMVGQAEPMLKYGVVVDAAATNQELLNMGIAGGAKNATNAQKMQARLNIIMAASSDAIGDAARTSDSWANQMKTLQANFENFQIFLGNKLLPILSPLLKQFNDFAQAIDYEKEFAKLQEGFDKIKEKMQPLIDVFNRLNEDGKLVNSMMAGLAGVGLVLLIGGFATLITTVLLATWPFILLAGVIAALWYAWESNLGGIQEKTQEVFGYIKDTLLPLLIEKFNQLKDWFINDGMPAIQSFIDTVWTNLVNAFEFFEQNILPVLIVVFNAFKDLLMNDVMPAVKELWESMVELWEVISPVVIPILKVLGAILLGVVVVAIGLVIGAIYTIIGVFKIFINIIKTTIDFATNQFKAFQRIIKGVFDVIAGIFTGDWSRAVDGFKDIGGGAVDFVVGKFQFLKDLVGDVLGGIGEVAGNIGGFGANVFNTVTGRATGGTVNEPVTLVGERGPELVSLPRGSRVTTAGNSRAQMRNQSGSNNPITINISLNVGSMLGSERDARDFVKAISRPLQREIQKLIPQTV